MPTPAASSQTTKSSRNGADLVVECLSAEGIRFVAGVPGEPRRWSCSIVWPVKTTSDSSSHDEQVAGFLADRVSRPGKQLGVCVVSRGPGATNAAIAVENATMSIPMLLLVGQVAWGDRRSARLRGDGPGVIPALLEVGCGDPARGSHPRTSPARGQDGCLRGTRPRRRVAATRRPANARLRRRQPINYSLPQHYGVVARIIPFNHPLTFVAGRVAAPA